VSTIVRARITAMPKQILDPMPEVWATLEDGSEVRVFDYYPDEISFSPSEFVGLTLAEARQLKFRKDVAYLRS
jgi:hypothetical protein